MPQHRLWRVPAASLKGLTVHEAATRMKVGKTALYEVLKTGLAQTTPPWHQPPRRRASDSAAKPTIPTAAARLMPCVTATLSRPRRVDVTALSTIHHPTDPANTPRRTIETAGPSGGSGPMTTPMAPTSRTRSNG